MTEAFVVELINFTRYAYLLAFVKVVSRLTFYSFLVQGFSLFLTV